jgi:hypothetical protein
MLARISLLKRTSGRSLCVVGPASTQTLRRPARQAARNRLAKTVTPPTLLGRISGSRYRRRVVAAQTYRSPPPVSITNALPVQPIRLNPPALITLTVQAASAV